jgi:hypothetical protein
MANLVVHGLAEAENVYDVVKPVHTARMARARPAGAGPRPVLVQLACADDKQAILKHSKELRARCVRLRTT